MKKKSKCFIWAQFGLSLRFRQFLFVVNGIEHRILTLITWANSDCSDEGRIIMRSVARAFAARIYKVMKVQSKCIPQAPLGTCG